MTLSMTHPGVQAAEPDLIIRLGGWLFRQRSWLPAPIVLALLTVPGSSRPSSILAVGVSIVLLGEAVRLWAVHHIGVISRTRAERLGPLVSTGPFAHVRNPLYLGNIFIWVGFTVSAGILWLVPIVLALLAVEYHAIVRWEEGLLSSRMGAPYHDYTSTVPRWIPTFRPFANDDATATIGAVDTVGGSWQATLFSERSTLIAVMLGYWLLWMKG